MEFELQIRVFSKKHTAPFLAPDLKEDVVWLKIPVNDGHLESMQVLQSSRNIDRQLYTRFKFRTRLHFSLQVCLRSPEVHQKDSGHVWPTTAPLGPSGLSLPPANGNYSLNWKHAGKGPRRPIDPSPSLTLRTSDSARGGGACCRPLGYICAARLQTQSSSTRKGCPSGRVPVPRT